MLQSANLNLRLLLLLLLLLFQLLQTLELGMLLAKLQLSKLLLLLCSGKLRFLPSYRWLTCAGRHDNISALSHNNRLLMYGWSGGMNGTPTSHHHLGLLLLRLRCWRLLRLSQLLLRALLLLLLQQHLLSEL